ncbi:MAG: PstS family phosphate ABC transporter substrate-binding protein [Bacteroidetes bacterium]|nr:PstS family phosphate ABC transporter substrate-binding protein [Bacteroidota bacterium]MBK9525317.1 PstS family phosphate ABC transporter substrate-binding protein [Bacteroidota bacterium]MBK9542416.1 PstS family phosphate ABC transporter substrate-binding protein [Bacteroidota bacterium]MBP6401980.1 PstS family phosphate ABC transporter substrate-binding protein [Bacteroidia bacterium]MBP6648186.1 PstS family phosphate ABC transporter substrate-binding protein [Bacteroidia bacterium]
MKKLIVFAVAICFSTVMSAQKIVIKGSDTVLPLSQKEAETYMKKNAGKSVTVVGGGSGVGISALLDNSTDIAMSSRKIKMDERMKLQDAGRAFKEVIIANDALSVIVNPTNKVGKLTREQLEGIFTGKIKNWKEVGGDDMQIIVYSRETSSGTYEFFKEHVMNRKNYASSVLNMPATGAIIQSVSQTKGAIGYVGLAYMNKEVKDIAVSYDKGKTYVNSSVEAARNKTYPIVRPLYYYYPTSKEASVKPFIDYVLSAEGQDLVNKVGYISLK